MGYTGQEKYRSLTKIFYKNAAACLIVYDITSKVSFTEIKEYWYNSLKEHASQNISIYKYNYYFSSCISW